MASTVSADLDYRPSYVAAGIASALVLLLYLVTLAPSTAMWDTSEYIAAAYILGLPHPPGNPFFVLIGKFFSLLPIAGSIAARINILAAVSSAVSAGAGRAPVLQRGLARAGAGLPALAGHPARRARWAHHLHAAVARGRLLARAAPRTMSPHARFRSLPPEGASTDGRAEPDPWREAGWIGWVHASRVARTAVEQTR